MSPDPTTVHPLPAHDRVVFLKPLVTSPNIDVDEYTYYDDPDGTWWDWPAEPVTEHTGTVMAGTPADIARIATEHGLGRPL